MLEPKQTVIDEITFYLQPLPALKALRLDKQIIALVIPVLSGIDGISLDSEFNLQKASQAVATALQNLSDVAFENLVLDLLSTTQVILPNETPKQFDKKTVDTVFVGGISTLYKLLFEVMEYNKFSPFVLLGQGGNAMQIINTFIEPKKSIVRRGAKSAK